MDTVSEPVTGVERDAGARARLVLRLYVAGSAPNSARAHANLMTLLERAGTDAYELEVVDCMLEPQRALLDGVLVTPTLVKVAPAPRETVIGTLSDARHVALVLGLVGRQGGGGATKSRKSVNSASMDGRDGMTTPLILCNKDNLWQPLKSSTADNDNLKGAKHDVLGEPPVLRFRGTKRRGISL